MHTMAEEIKIVDFQRRLVRRKTLRPRPGGRLEGELVGKRWDIYIVGGAMRAKALALDSYGHYGSRRGYTILGVEGGGTNTCWAELRIDKVCMAEAGFNWRGEARWPLKSVHPLL